MRLSSSLDGFSFFVCVWLSRALNNGGESVRVLRDEKMERGVPCIDLFTFMNGDFVLTKIKWRAFCYLWFTFPFLFS